jgi:hypothetical protein
MRISSTKRAKSSAYIHVNQTKRPEICFYCYLYTYRIVEDELILSSINASPQQV